MITRRDFFSIATTFFLNSKKLLLFFDENFAIFDQIITKSKKEHWDNLPIGELIGKIGLECINIPYLGNTLETGTDEKCIVTFQGFDCVTFLEVSLCLARIIKKRKYSFEDLINEVTFTRYRNGKIKDYTSRLHYTADWIYDNIRKNVLQDKTEQLGGYTHRFRVSFMSTNPDKYPGLKNNPQQVQKIAEIEKEINKRSYNLLPKEDVKKIESKLLTGYIIAIATQKSGLDYSHTGLIYQIEKKPRFLHASSKKKKVVLDDTISNYLTQNKDAIGITILEPLEP